jgi:tRNA nucleotidyltransferase (CCA-adding enzyme)
MNLSAELEELLSPEAFQFCRDVSALGAEDGVGVWLTGGLVRDLILGRSSKDLDISVSSRGTDFAKKLSKRFGIALSTVFERYGCVVLRLADGSRCDMVPLRQECYRAPAAPPEITYIDSIERDLFRRDFTVNAMAISLSHTEFGELRDFYGGLEDLHTKTLRVIHDKSFMDDPVRIFRGIRFAARMNLILAPESRDVLFRSYDEGALNFLKSDVFLREFESTFSAPHISLILGHLDNWAVFQQLGWPGLAEGFPPVVVTRLSLIWDIISTLLRSRRTLRVRKCSWLAVLAVLVLIPSGGMDYFMVRFSVPRYLVAYLDEVQVFSSELVSSLNAGSAALVECLKRPRKTETLVGAIAVASHNEEEKRRYIESLS